MVVRQIWTAASTAQHRPRPGLTAPGFIAQALPALRGAGVERGMAHFSYASPDRKWVLVIEMDHTGAWQRCRLFPLDRSAVGVAVGPPGHCTATAWSPDGRWMYFTGGSASSGDHLWRQRFGKAEPEQVTFGPTEEQGIAAAPDGR